MSDPNIDRICERFQQRSDAGCDKYGCTTERTDLSLLDWINHLQEELMDAVVYIEAAKARIK